MSEGAKSPVRDAWNRYFYGDVAAVRPYLFTKAFLLLLALDSWVVMIEHGGRYGAGGFNVAHFAWLDAIQPVPTAATYVGLMLGIGVLAFALLLVGSSRIGLGALCVLYTYGWAMSMLDSYQHHYLVSILLLCMAFFPRIGARDLCAEDSPIRRTRAWGYVLAGVSIAIVYVFTAISKTEPDWRNGHALQRITETTGVLVPLETWFMDRGWESESFWSLLGTGMIAVQVVIAIGYLVAPRRDSVTSRPVRIVLAVVGWAAFAAAAAFHVGAEIMDLRIGWFSYYMIATACIFFLPERALVVLTQVASAPARGLARLWAEMEEPGPVVVVGMAVGASIVIVFAGVIVNLPGAVGAMIAASAVLVAGIVYAAVRRRARDAQKWLVAVLVSACVMWLAIASSTVRFDFYRFVGGDARRRGDLELALDAYENANRYAPPGKSRRDRIDSLRQALGR